MSTPSERKIVTIYEEYGAGAGVVGRLVADALGVAYVGKAVSSESIEEAAELADEEGSFFERFLRSFTPMPTADADIAWALEARSDAEVAEQNVSSLRELVANGAVVHGRSGASVLADEPCALHVKLVAPARHASRTRPSSRASRPSGRASGKSARTGSAPTWPSASTAGIRRGPTTSTSSSTPASSHPSRLPT